MFKNAWQETQIHEAMKCWHHNKKNVWPVSGLQAVQSVVVFVVQCSLCCPVDQSFREKHHKDAVEPGDSRHVQRKPTGGHPTNYPGPISCAEECLSERKRMSLCPVIYIYKIGIGGKAFQFFVSHLLCWSTDLHSNISSRIPNANYQHPLSSAGICIFILPTVKAPARKHLISWRDTDGTNTSI